MSKAGRFADNTVYTTKRTSKVKKKIENKLFFKQQILI